MGVLESQPLQGRNIGGQQLPTLLDVTSCVRLHTLLRVVAQSLTCKRTQQLPSSNESKIYLHVANVLVGGGGGGGGGFRGK